MLEKMWQEKNDAISRAKEVGAVVVTKLKKAMLNKVTTSPGTSW